VTAKKVSDPRVHSILLRTDRLVIFVPRSHSWATRKSLALKALAGRDLVIRERGSITREVFEARLAEAGVKPGALVEVETREAVKEAVAAGFGIGIIFDSEFGQDQNAAKLAVRGTDLKVAEYLVCLEERRRIPLVRTFLEFVPASAKLV
jgi:LysR family transcriptional regulator, low CO2-responsive transcriptional regulator